MELPQMTLLEALLERRSRRFCLGMAIQRGPLAFKSRYPPRPLSDVEEAIIAFAAAGITGRAAADLEYNQGGGGNIMAGLIGRTVASGDGIQTVSLFLINDQGAWLYRRPNELPVETIHEVLELARSRDFEKISRLTRVQVAPERVRPPSDPLFNINVNRWSAYAPGTSYFLPVNELTFMYINGLLEVLNPDTGAYILDERRGFRPAGLKSFAKSRGGHLLDDPVQGRPATIALVERLVTEFVTLEQGMMLQNAALVAHALGLGGFPNFANHDFGWFQALGFEMESRKATDYLGIRGIPRWGLKLLGKDAAVPLATALRRDGITLLKSYCPPNFASMRAAVEAVVEHKVRTFSQNTSLHPWKNSGVAGAVEKVDERAVEATVAYCEYVWKTFGRFPAYMPPFRTVAGFQAGLLDLEFYEQHYPRESIPETHRRRSAQATANSL